MTRILAIAPPLLALLVTAGSMRLAPVSAQAGPRPRVIVSTDIGGTDPDDFQSMVHFLALRRHVRRRGARLVPVRPRPARAHPRGHRQLRGRLPEPEDATPTATRRPTRCGRSPSRARSRSGAGPAFGRSTEGSDWIVARARRDDPRPLWVLVWGGIDDLAQALHDAPDILPKLRVYFIGGPNKMWSVNAYNYIEQHHPKLWMIEANATYRGWFTGGDQTGEWGNSAFVAAHVAGHGALGDYFATLLRGTIKMGDSPSVGYLLHGTPEDPVAAGLGRKVRAHLGWTQDRSSPASRQRRTRSRLSAWSSSRCRFPPA